MAESDANSEVGEFSDLLESREDSRIGGLDPVVSEAKRRWDLCSEWESPFRERFIDDVKFANADSDNGFQWPNAIRRARDSVTTRS